MKYKHEEARDLYKMSLANQARHCVEQINLADTTQEAADWARELGNVRRKLQRSEPTDY